MNTPAQNTQSPQVEAGSGARLGQGNVEIMIGDTPYVLKPSLMAMQQLSRKYGGLMEVIQKVGVIDFDVIMEVMYLGLGPTYATNARKRGELAQAVYAQGLLDPKPGVPGIAARVQQYIGALMRGGKPAPIPGTVDDEKEADEDEGEAKNPQSSNN